MKIRVKVNVRELLVGQRSRGFAAMAMVAALGITALLGLMFVFRRGVHSHDAQVRHQVKIDFKQKEDAFLRALIAEVPNAAIAGMMGDSWDNRTPHGWNRIIQRAIDLSNSEQAVSSTTLSSMGIGNHIVANSGDYSIGASINLVSPIAGRGPLVGSGTIVNTDLLADPEVGDRLPPPLRYYGQNNRDRYFPIISERKRYVPGTPGLGASAANSAGYPVYNIIDYPDIRFGFAAQDGRFVAKRNWWAFSVNFGGTIEAGADIESSVASVRKNYVLSIYEVPAQSAVSAAADLKLGEYANGANWQNTTIRGGVFSTEIDVRAGVNLLDHVNGDSRIAARNSINLGNNTVQVSGAAVAGGYNNLGVREVRMAAGEQFYGASTAGDSGRVAILPLGQGEQFFRRTDDAQGMDNAISNTTWDEYALGARQCAMSLEVRTMATGGRPVAVRLHYYNGSNRVYQDYVEGQASWPNYHYNTNATPDSPPFYFERVAQNAASALAIDLARLPNYVRNVLGGNRAAGNNMSRLNNSLCVWTNETESTVSKPPMGSNNNYMSVVLHDTEDLSMYVDGFSLVTDHRVYIAGNFNQVPVPSARVPASAGLPAGTFFAPVSIFAPTLRFGTNTGTLTQLNISGQLRSLKDGDVDTNAINILDFKQSVGGAAQPIDHNIVSADLSQITSPAQLPPVNKMSWLVVIEEIHPD
ncbi:MAG: hypothetical protein L3J79_02895 [Candidatus Marinimicrobia bacterium]|nr:hypothetical protein [Candidatus Neomarinimicrobiota bacterium]